MLKLFDTIKNAVKEINPNTEIGFISCGPTVAKTEWILASGSTLCRPGGGFYNGEQPISVFNKSFSIQQQIKQVPSVSNLQMLLTGHQVASFP